MSDEYDLAYKGVDELKTETSVDFLLGSKDGKPSKITATNAINGDLGWGYYQDNDYTSGSPLAINNARTQITINGEGGSTVTSQLPDYGHVWDTTNDKILMENVGDAYTFRFDWKGTTSTANAFFNLNLDIGSGSPINIVTSTFNFLKGTGVEQIFSTTISAFALATHIANGGKLYLDTSVDPCNCNFYDFGIKVERTYNGVT